MTSKLEFISLGVVAEDKVKNDFEILVWPIEISPNMTGDITEKIPVSGEVVNAYGGKIAVSLSKKKHVTAKWLADGVANRATPPDVMKGMTVKLYNYAGTTDYYWSPLYFEPDLAKQERVIYFYSNKTEVASNAISSAISDISGGLIEKGYYFIIDTYAKFIGVHTSDNDGEACTYDVEIDTKNGVLTIKDNKDNFIELQSQKGQLTITLQGDMITTVKQNVTTTIEGEVKTEIKKNVTTTIEEGVKAKTPKNIEVELDKISVKNNTAELIDLLTQLVQANIEEQHLGNMGAPTALMATSVQKYQEILQKLQTFKL